MSNHSLVVSPSLSLPLSLFLSSAFVCPPSARVSLSSPSGEHRTKSKIKNAETMKKVNELKHENESLRSKVTCLATELRLLKNVLAAHASSAHGAHLSEFDIKLLTSTETLSLASPSASPVPSPPIVATGTGTIFGQSKHSHNQQQQQQHLHGIHHAHHLHHHHHHHASLNSRHPTHHPQAHAASTVGSAYDSLRSSLVQSSSFRDSLIRESIIHRNRMDSLSSSSSSSSISPIMSPASPAPISHSMLESFYLSNGLSHSSSNNPNLPSTNSDNNLLFKQTRPRMSPVASLNSFNSRSSCNDSEDDY